MLSKKREFRVLRCLALPSEEGVACVHEIAARGGRKGHSRDKVRDSTCGVRYDVA